MNAPLACGPLELGCWIDDGPALVLEQPYLDRLRALPLSHLAVMLDGPKPGLEDAKWSTAQLAELAAALPGVERILTVWGSPAMADVQELEEDLPALLAALGSRVVELDLEPVGHWRRRNVEGFAGLGDAGRGIVESCRRAGAERVEVTVFLGALPGAAGAIAAADRLVLQCYPTASKGSYVGAMGPKRRPREALELARRRFAHVELAVGLPAYGQNWPGVDPVDAMHAAIASAAEAGVHVVREWSGKWLVRKKTKRYAARALEELRPIAVVR